MGLLWCPSVMYVPCASVRACARGPSAQVSRGGGQVEVADARWLSLRDGEPVRQQPSPRATSYSAPPRKEETCAHTTYT